jgi:hypothetical protein
MELLVVILSWLVFGGAASYFASQRGRDPFAWFMIGMLLGILGLLLLFLLPPLENEKKEPVEPEEIAPVITEPAERLTDWFYLDKNRIQVGPVAFNALKRAWDDKEITIETLVWREGMGEWKKVAELPSLREVLQ